MNVSTFYRDLHSHRDLLENVLLQLPFRQLITTAQATKIGSEIVKDQAFWKKKFEIDNPDIFKKIEKLLPSDFNWKVASSYDLDGDIYSKIHSIIQTDQSRTIGDLINALIDSGMLTLGDIKKILADVRADYVYPVNALSKIVRKVIENEENLLNPQVFSNERYRLLLELLILSAKADDVELLKFLLEKSKGAVESLKIMMLHCDLRSIDALNVLLPYLEMEDREYVILETASRVCVSVQCFQDLISLHQIEIDDIQEQFITIDSHNTTIIKYLVEDLGLNPFLNEVVLHNAIFDGQVTTVEYLLSTQKFQTAQIKFDESFRVALGHNTYPRWVQKATPEENYRFFENRKKIFELLIQHQVFDDQLFKTGNFARMNPPATEGEPRRQMNQMIADWFRLIIHRLDLPITDKMIIDAIRWKNWHLVKVFVLDHRVGVDRVEALTKNAKVLKRLPKLQELKDRLPWSLRRIHTLKGLTNHQKYELMVALQLEEKLDPLLSQLLNN
ncbi:Hypothetical protein POVR1_LOCUS349 [uncultured virus]|nr:Hypothetical protein POVR1_LOCUS349 [uncultured virus]